MNLPPLNPAMAPRDLSFYESFGVSPDASLEEIKAAYKKFGLKFHPDRRMHLPEQFRDEALLRMLFQVASNIFAVLSDHQNA